MRQAGRKISEPDVCAKAMYEKLKVILDAAVCAVGPAAAAAAVLFVRVEEGGVGIL